MAKAKDEWERVVDAVRAAEGAIKAAEAAEIERGRKVLFLARMFDDYMQRPSDMNWVSVQRAYEQLKREGVL